MASSSSQSMATIDDYVLNFRSELQSVAKTCLAGLEFKITEEGDGWLDAHLEAVFNSTSSAPIVQHLKTPSKTATMKKTRAKLELEKQRTDKVKIINAKLALSPSRSQNGSPARLLFQPTNSPLQPRSMNATSPSPMKSKLGPNKPHVVDLASKGKKGKGKQVDGENAAPDPSPAPARTAVRPALELGSPAARSPRAAAKATHASPTRPPKSPLRQTKFASPSPRSPPTRSTRPQSPQQAIQMNAGSSSRPSSRAAASPAQPTRKDLSMIAENTSERSSAGSRQPIRSPPRSRPQSPLRTRPLSPRLAAQQAARSPPRSTARKEAAPQPSIEAVLRPAVTVAPPLLSTAQPATVVINAAPVPAPAPSAPIRSVRSSWLSKALGSGTVPTTGHADSTATFRKSVVPQARPTLQNDYAGLRESLAPPQGLKRKSDQGLEEEQEAPRPEKIVKIDTTPAPAPILAAVPASRPPSLFERKVSQPATTAPALALTPAPIAQPDSEVARVRNALDAIKERAAAKELAMQNATLLAAASGDGTRRDAVSGGTSFFRGLTKSLGIGGKMETPEEEKERLAIEIEDEREAAAEAQAHLQKLLNGIANEPAPKEDVVTAPNARSTTPVFSPPPQIVQPVEAHPAFDRTEAEEDAEEEQMVEDISIVQEEEELEVSEEMENVEQIKLPSTTPIAKAAPRLQTPPAFPSIRLSTTPTTTPPAHRTQVQRSAFNAQAQTKTVTGPAQHKPTEIAQTIKSVNKDEIIDIDADTEDEEEDDEDMEIGKNVAQHVKHIQKNQAQTTVPRLPKSSSSVSLAPSASTNGLLNQATTIAAKTLGVKPTTAPVKSVQVAQAAAKKEQDAANRKQTFREQADARRLEAARKKAEDEKARVAEQERIRVQEAERSQKLKAELERKKAERETVVAQAYKSQTDRLQKEQAAAKAKAAEDEANRKRKMAPTLNKSTIQPAKKPQPATNSGRETFRPTSSMKGAPPQASGNSQASSSAAKLGPTSFRTAPTAPQPQAPQPTVKLVSVNPANLGPPSRPSGMTGTHPHPQWSHIPTGTSGPSNVLQQQRVALQTQLDDKALNTQSEDIELPDINSEYSDSDDSEKSTDFKRPDWAESPELRAALERQATRNPDELFGPIKPISMEELFKVKVSKFRPRSSSANWASGDGVTKKEEVDYAKRMGFRNTGARGEGSSGSGL